MYSSPDTMHPGIAARIGLPLLTAMLLAFIAFDDAQSQQASAQSDSISLTDIEIDIPSYVALAGERFVLVSGPAQYLGWIDLQTGRATRLSRTGEGPGEFSAIGAVFGCADAAGWIDRNLRRIVWLSPDTGQYIKQLVLPADVAVFGLPVSATCKDGSVWFALESRTYGKAAVVTDTVRVFRTSANDARIQLLATVLGSTRHVRAEGSLNASLRAPWTAHPELVPLDAQRLALVYRRTDSVRIVSTRNEQAAAYPLRAAGMPVNAPVRRAVIDSLRMLSETEMAGLRLDEAFRESFRKFYSPMLAQLPLPRVSPVVNRAWADTGAAGQFVALENGAPGAGESCLSVFAADGRRTVRRCYAWRDRTTHAVLTTSTHVLWFQTNEDGESWLLRTTRP